MITTIQKKKLLLAFTEQLGFIKTNWSSTYRKDDHNKEVKDGGKLEKDCDVEQEK